ncbi:hypothetical protein EPO15_18060 [bacterium]|nr:MAG: hypothetical protein EPO15_18060 [bacterium]
MKNFNEIRRNLADEALRWGFTLLAAALAALLLATLETGAHAAGSSFSFQGYLAKFITPNGDAKNDTAILCVDNPKDFTVRGQIFDLRGQHVADMAHVVDTTKLDATKPVKLCNTTFGGQFKPQAVVWDGKTSGGAVVTSGVYVWRVEAEESTVTGTVLVVR